MTSWGFCVIAFDFSGEPVVRPDEPAAVPPTDVSAPSLRLLRQLRRRSWEDPGGGRAMKRALSRSYSLFYILGFHSAQQLTSFNFAGDAESIPIISGKEDVLTGVGDWWAVEGASHSCYQEPSTVGCGPPPDDHETVHTQDWSQECLEKAFDVGSVRVQMRNLLKLFRVDSKYFNHIFDF